MKISPVNMTYPTSLNIYNKKYKKADNISQIPQYSRNYKYFDITGGYNPSFLGKKGAPFYSVNLKTGERIKFDDRKTVQERLGCRKEYIGACLQGKRAVSSGYAFIYADTVEREDENGDRIVDEAEFDKEIKRIDELVNSHDTPSPCYSIDRNGNCVKYESRYQAAKNTGANQRSISNVLNKKCKKTGGYIFVEPDEIEITDSAGNIAIDKRKAAQLVFSAFIESDNGTPVYSIDKNGNYQRYPRLIDAAAANSADTGLILKALRKEIKRAKNLAWAYAADVEYIDENNNIRPDVQKLEAINRESLAAQDNGVPVYTVDYNGKLTKYKSSQAAASSLGVHYHTVLRALNGEINTVKGTSLVRADEVENKDENGKIVLDSGVLKEKWELANKNSIYALYKDGTYKKYISVHKASEESETGKSSIKNCLNGRSGSTKDGVTFVRASDVEHWDKDRVVVDTTLIGKLTKQLAAAGVRPVYVFSSDGNWRRFSDVKEVTQSGEFAAAGVSRALSGRIEKYKGHKFFYADEFETYDKEGKPVINYDKLDETACEINPEIKKRIKKYGKIYALKGVDVFEHENIRKAARELGEDENLIVYFLEHGINPLDGSNTINGYVFSSEKDLK